MTDSNTHAKGDRFKERRQFNTRHRHMPMVRVRLKTASWQFNTRQRHMRMVTVRLKTASWQFNTRERDTNR